MRPIGVDEHLEFRTAETSYVFLYMNLRESTYTS